MKREEFFFDSRDGETKLYAVRYLPEGQPRAIVQIVHGMAEHMGRYEKLAVFLAEQGFLVTGEDHLGHGKSISQKGKGYFCEVDPATVLVRDVHRLKKMTQEQFPGIPCFILGHSMGSLILRNYLYRYGTGIRGAVAVGTGNQPNSVLAVGKIVGGLQKVIFGERHVSRLLDRMAFGAYNKRIEHPRTPYDWFSVDSENVDRYMADPLCGFVFTVNGFRGIFELLSRLNKPEAIETIPKELPILLMAGGQDPVGHYGAAVEELAKNYREVGIRNVSCKIYPDDRHEIFNEKDAPVVCSDLIRWLEEVLK